MGSIPRRFRGSLAALLGPRAEKPAVPAGTPGKPAGPAPLPPAPSVGRPAESSGVQTETANKEETPRTAP